MQTFHLFRQLAALASVAASLTVSMQVVADTPPAAAADQSVAWQVNPQHDGFDPSSPLVTPLTLKWQQDLTSRGVVSISYPLIAHGLVLVTVANADGTESLIALDEAAGRKVWSVDVSGLYSFANAAYDSGKVVAVNADGVMKAVDAATGTVLWSVSLPGQYFFTSPPTASSGTVYTGGAGSGGTLYAVDETNGAVLWTASVENGDSSSPALIFGHVFVSYACPQSYAFEPATGQLLWHYSGPCEGGGGATPVAHAGRLYVRDSFATNANGLILDGTMGKRRGTFNSDVPPAFAGNLALYLQSGTLRGVNVARGNVLWSFAGDGGLTSAPLIVNRTIYIGSSSGLLYGLDLQGHQVWSTQVGAPITGSNEGSTLPTTGLGAGDSLLIVPAGAVLAAYGN